MDIGINFAYHYQTKKHEEICIVHITSVTNY